MYNIILIDPRPAQKDAMITLLEQNAPVIGIEFTLTELKQYIAANIDGQHYSNANLAACEIAINCNLPVEKATLAIVRPDVDALLACVIFNLRNDCADFTKMMMERIGMVADADKFARGPWRGPRPMGLDNGQVEFKALGVICSNHTMRIQERIALIEQWLISGKCDGLEGAASQAVRAFNNAMDDSLIEVDGDIAIIESHHMGATEVGYHYAPIVIIKNGAFRFPGVQGTHVKYTICQYQDMYLDMKAIVNRLNQIETVAGTWGGSPTIAGSPQGVSSSLSMKKVVEVVKQHFVVY